MLIFGNGETAKLAKYYFENEPNRVVSGFVVDDEYATGELLGGLPVFRLSEATSGLMHCALSYRGLNRIRAVKYDELRERGFTFASYISSRATVLSSNIGDNAFILENNVVQPGVKIDDNVMLWSGNHIGHGSRIGAHTYISSHVVICGNCTIGERNFFGVNAAVKDFTTIGNDCFITMGAIVTKDMPDGSVAIDREIIVGEKAQRIKDRYFASH